MAGERSGGGSDPFRRDDVVRPGPVESARQLAVVAVILLLWVGTFRFAMNLPGEATDPPRERAAAAPTGREAGASAPDGAAAGDPSEGTREPAAPPVPERVAAAAGTPPTEGAAASPPVADSAVPPRDSAAPVQDGRTPPNAAAGPPARDPAAAPAPVDDDDPVTALDTPAAQRRIPDLDDLPEVSFAGDVMPILERRCVKCHGAPRSDGTPRIEEGLDLRTWAAVMAGSTWGPVVEPGDPVASYLLELVVDGDMPEDGPRLLPREIRVLTAWIAAGAARN